MNNFDCRAFSRYVNKGKMHKITISSNSSGPCGKLGSTKLGVQELEVGNAFRLEFPGFWKKKITGTRANTLKSLYLI